MSYAHDQKILMDIAADVARRLQGRFSVETVERLLRESYDVLAATSKVTTYLPLLAQRFAANA